MGLYDERDQFQKLNDHIAAGLTREADVAYVLTQLGKLVERERPRHYPVLRFYRNWVAHEKLSSVNANPPMRDILNNFEQLFQAVQAGGNAMQMTRQIADSVSLSRLEADINQVFDDFPAFDRGRLDRPERWPNFRPLLLSILSDISLHADASYRHVGELTIASINARFDTLVVTDRTGHSMNLPLMP